ncbi:MAG TPA: DNA-processing protein DprA [Pseudobdellovibrionaceae bacterium]|jgi:DNA processing protein
MEKLIHFSLIHKNLGLLQNYRRLRESIEAMSISCSCEELRAYLREQEPFFFREVCERPSTLQRESEELTRLKNRGVNFTYIGESSYPISFHNMPGAPLFLSYRGHPTWLRGKSLAVVGSRDASQLSHLWMEESFAEFLRQEKPVVVSGGARGIDQMAHQLALRNSCSTVVVLPSGLEFLYPKTLEAWQAKIIEGGGCLLSEYSYSEKMQKHFFHDRNRLIAGLGVMTLLVESRRRSGSLLTAQKTLQLGKTVLIVPGHPCDNSHLGNLDLLSEGATPIRDAEELCMYFRSELSLLSKFIPIASEIQF